MARRKAASAVENIDEFVTVPKEECPYELPAGWKWVRLGSIIEASKETTDVFDSTQKYIGLENMQKGAGITGCRGATGIRSLKNVFHENCILYGKLRPYLNKHGIADFDGVCSTDILVFNAKDNVLPQYVNYYFDTDSFFQYVVENSKGINLPRVSEKVVLDAICPLPPLSVQNSIIKKIEFLFVKLSSAKDLVQNVLDSCETSKAAILHKAFTGELTAKWREEHAISLSSWQFKKLCDTDFNIIDGDRSHNYPQKNELKDNGYCVFLNTKNVTKEGFVFTKIQYITKEKDALLHNGKLVRGDIVLTTRGTVGNIAYYNDEIPYKNMRINSGMVIYRGDTSIYKPYICWLYKSDYILNQIANITTGSAQPQLPIKTMKNLILPLPNYEEQQYISAILDDYCSKESLANDSVDIIDKIEMVKRAVLDMAFHGNL